MSGKLSAQSWNGTHRRVEWQMNRGAAMKYTIRDDRLNGVCEISVSGTLKRPQGSQELMQVSSQYAKEHGCMRFLFDLRYQFGIKHLVIFI